MRLSRSLAIVAFAVIVFGGAAFADSFNFAANGTGDLSGSFAQTFTVGSSSITLEGFTADGTANATDLWYKNGSGDENGLGLTVGGSDREIGGDHFIQFTDAGIASISIGSVQSGESWTLYGSSTLGTRGTTVLATGTGDATVLLPGIDSGYTYLSLFSPKGDVLLDSATSVVPEPGTTAFMLTLGIVGLFEVGRRKLFA
ncbi:MAG: hypothetical protein ACRD2U_14050 [Terriglobales bacterium]